MQFLVSSERSLYHGLRMSADEYFALGETFERYELIDGVVVMSPSPTPLHQRILVIIVAEIHQYLKTRPLGNVYLELDVNLGQGPHGSDLVYRPDVVFFSSGRLTVRAKRVTVAPDLVVEVVSPGSRRMDFETKKGDYERFGVPEYWIIDPEEKSMFFYRLREGKYIEMAPHADVFESTAIGGFKLDLLQIKKEFDDR